MNRDGDRYPVLSSSSAYPDTSWRGIADLSSTPSLKRRLQRTLSLHTQQLPPLSGQLAQVPDLLQRRVISQLRQQMPRVRQFIDAQIQQMPARVEYMRHAHQQKQGKLIVRGLFAVSGSLSLLDLTLIEQLWF